VAFPAGGSERKEGEGVSNELNNSLNEGDRARALHRVVRAMHDGNCPKCGHLGSSTSFWMGSGHRCPECDFYISESHARAAMMAFRPFMEKNLAVFEEWRAALSQGGAP
jgi:hypothetical protein